MTGDPPALNEAAFDQFVDHFRRKIFHYSWLMCGSREDAEEVAQETLLNVFQNFDQLREPERVRPWVFRIAKNACLMMRRKSIFAPDRELPLDDENRHLDVVDRSAAPEDHAQQAEMNALLARAIRDLPPAYRSVVLLRDIEELSTEETAHILDLSEDAVKTRLHRARAALRQKLDQFLSIPPPFEDLPQPAGKHPQDQLWQAFRNVRP